MEINTSDKDILWIGAFASYELLSKRHHGIITDLSDHQAFLTDYEEGMPLSRWIDPAALTKLTKDEMLNHYKTVSAAFAANAPDKGILGAYHARLRFSVDTAMTWISKLDEDYAAQWIMMHSMPSEMPTPKSGVYVTRGIYSGYGFGEVFEGIFLQPRLHETIVSTILSSLCPSGLGRIFPSLAGGASVGKNDLIGYRVYEIPDDAVSLVTRPKTLEMRIR